MPYFTFHQNNSGGVYELDQDKGIAEQVVVEAHDWSHANVLAQRIGLYFDGVVGEQDCSCCGDRWYAKEEREHGDPVPSYYGVPLSSAKVLSLHREYPVNTYVHLLDGKRLAYRWNNDRLDLVEP